MAPSEPPDFFRPAWTLETFRGQVAPVTCVSLQLCPKSAASSGCSGFTVKLYFNYCSYTKLYIIYFPYVPMSMARLGPSGSQHVPTATTSGRVFRVPFGVPAIAIWLEKEGKPRPKQRPVQPTWIIRMKNCNQQFSTGITHFGTEDQAGFGYSSADPEKSQLQGESWCGTTVRQFDWKT